MNQAEVLEFFDHRSGLDRRRRPRRVDDPVSFYRDAAKAAGQEKLYGPEDIMVRMNLTTIAWALHALTELYLREVDKYRDSGGAAVYALGIINRAEAINAMSEARRRWIRGES